MKQSIIKASCFISIISLIILGSMSASLSQPREIRIADSKGDWGYPNPYRHYPRGPGYIRMSWVFDTLIWKDKEGYIPALAKSWSYDPARQAFIFDLHPKARWHDGKPLTSEDVVFTLEYFKKHPYTWITVDHISRSEADGPHRIIIYLSIPYAPFLADIGGTMPVLPKHIWEKVENPESYNDPAAFMGSGPYIFRDFNKAQGSYLYEAFRDYYQGVPKAERLIYVRSGMPLVSLTTGETDLAAIQADMATTLKQKGMTILMDERGWNKKLMINHKKAPFNNVLFRRALAHAIDRHEIIEKSQRGLGAPASYGLLSVDHDMYNPGTPTYEHDPKKAADMILAMGYKKGSDGYFVKEGRPLQLEILASNITVAGQSVTDRDGEIIRNQLEAAGIRVDLVNMEQATTDSMVKKWDFDLAISGHGGVSGDPRILNEMISSKYGSGSVNSARYDENQGLNKLMEDQMIEMDPEKRKAIVFKIQEIYAKDLPAIPLYYPDTFSAYNPEKGIKWFYTKGGISKGIPISQNKMSLIK